MAKIDQAKAMYGTLCETLDKMQWSYNKEENDDNFAVFTSARGDDLVIKLAIRIDVNRQVMFLKSPLPFQVPRNLRDTVARALIRANWTMLNGSFEMDLADGYVGFKMVIPYMDSMISTEVCRYMILLSCRMTDKFNDKIKDVVDGKMTEEQFVRFIDGTKD